jgi:NitT/TauT family transport system substrate-binding protein
MKTRLITAVAALMLLAPIAGGTQEPLTIIVAGAPGDDNVALWYGMNSGLFHRVGINVEYQKSTSGADAVLGVVGGSYQIADTDSLTLVQAHSKGVPLEYIAPSGIYNSTTEYVATVVRKDSQLQSARDLNGLVFGGGPVKALNAIALMSWMDQNGGDISSVKFLEIPVPAAAAALEERRIDVSTLYQPFLSAALAAGKVRLFAKTFDAISPRFVTSTWITSTSWSAANADVVRRFVRVIREAEIYCNAHRAESAALLAQHSGIDLQVILAGGRDTFAATFANPKDLQPLIDTAAKYGAIEKRFDAAELLSPAVQRLKP